MTFTDDLAGLPRAEQIARVQAAARQHGDELDESQAAQALSLYATLVTGTDSRTAARTGYQATAGGERVYDRQRRQAPVEGPAMDSGDLARPAATARRQWRAGPDSPATDADPQAGA